MKEKTPSTIVDKAPSGRKAIHPAHENFNMVFNIMLGIKKAVDSA